jgi:predicted GNAT family N-acyltransferase
MEWIQVKTVQELELCFAVRRAVFVVEQQIPESLEMDEYDNSPDSCRHWLGCADGHPVAAGRWREYAPGVAKLQRIAVLAPYRGKGVGRQLIRVLEEDVLRMGGVTAILDAQLTVEPFYRQLGYRTVSSEPFFEAGIPHVRMEKSLT